MIRGLISIIVPVYKAKTFLEECVHSILAQSYSNLQVILVNDGCPDGSGELCDKLAETDSRIVVVHKQNGGPATARNAGLDIADGEFIGFVDSDDTIDTTMYQQLHSRLTDTCADFCVCGYKVLYNNGEFNVRTFSVDKKYYPQGIVEMYINNHRSLPGLFTGSCNKLYRTSLVDEIRFPIWPRAVDNQIITDSGTAFIALCVASSNNGITTLDITPYNYQATENSLSTISSYKNLEMIFEYMQGVMIEILPDRKEDILRTIYCNLHTSLVNSNHNSILRGLPVSRKLRFSELWIIIRHSPSFDIIGRMQAILMYVTHAKLYRMLFKLYSNVLR